MYLCEPVLHRVLSHVWPFESLTCISNYTCVCVYMFKCISVYMCVLCSAILLHVCLCMHEYYPRLYVSLLLMCAHEYMSVFPHAHLPVHGLYVHMHTSVYMCACMLGAQAVRGPHLSTACTW